MAQVVCSGIDEIHNPGSGEAIEQGCTCPVMDNSYGMGMLGGSVLHPDTGKPVFIFHEDCPVHGLGTGAMCEIKEQ